MQKVEGGFLGIMEAPLPTHMQRRELRSNPVSVYVLIIVTITTSQTTCTYLPSVQRLSYIDVLIRHAIPLPGPGHHGLSVYRPKSKLV